MEANLKNGAVGLLLEMSWRLFSIDRLVLGL